MWIGNMVNDFADLIKKSRVLYVAFWYVQRVPAPWYRQYHGLQSLDPAIAVFAVSMTFLIPFCFDRSKEEVTSSKSHILYLSPFWWDKKRGKQNMHRTLSILMGSEQKWHMGSVSSIDSSVVVSQPICSFERREALIGARKGKCRNKCLILVVLQKKKKEVSRTWLVQITCFGGAREEVIHSDVTKSE